MAKKRVTLPKNFEDLLKKGNLEELKAVYTKCELEARGGLGKRTAFSFDECPHELAKWLVEQGANLQSTDSYGSTALHERSGSIFGNIKSLLELGADVNDNRGSRGIPLHSASSALNAENTALLLAHGAQIDALNKDGYTPLEQALRTCSNIGIVKTVELSKIHFNAGAQITDKMKSFVTRIGKDFEFHRANFNKESVDEYSDALDKLYRIFEVTPVGKRKVHDGKSPIITQTTTWQKQHRELWNLLVPSSGACETIQGELIRITGRIDNELEGNGGINWDTDYRKMADTFLSFIKQGNPLSPAELTEAEELIKEIKQRSGNTVRICELAVKWVIENPLPLQLTAVEYER